MQPGFINARAFGLYGLAYLGAHLSFMPVFILLLPRRVSAVAPDDPATLLSWLLLVGGLVAAISHIVAGATSDKVIVARGSRRLLIVAGLIALAAAYLLLAVAGNPLTLFAGVISLQIAINMFFAPLGALLADYFPNRKKGMMSAIMNSALPLSGAASGLIAYGFPVDDRTGFIFTGALSIGLMMPLLIWWPFGSLVTADRTSLIEDQPADARPVSLKADFAKAWIARLLIQLGSAFLVGYLFLYLAELASSSGALGTGTASEWLGAIAIPAGTFALVATLAAGSASDRLGRRRLPLALAAICVALSLTGVSFSSGIIAFLVFYACFQTGLAVFLSLETAMIAQLVSGNDRRGAMLGVMNLTNTLPTIIAPSLALIALDSSTIAPALSTIFLVCAAGSLVAAASVSTIKGAR